MPALLRVFISSTMKDLRNERAEVATRLRSFNLEPICAEDLMPTGGDPWSLLETRSSRVTCLC